MILVDTSVWVDHFRRGDNGLADQLAAGMVLTHPFVIGELALGNPRQRDVVLDALADLPPAQVATDAEALRFIARHGLAGNGVGYIDVHLLAAARLTPGANLWTGDRRLHGLAAKLGLAFQPQPRRARLTRPRDRA